MRVLNTGTYVYCLPEKSSGGVRPKINRWREVGIVLDRSKFIQWRKLSEKATR